ncbi:hypothetical protein C8R45DRAFT_1084175 [Mycena sanguinolenta]|nr:hypothetical protein C8R45DRAFT_1084175 [Mycena sanguinolenta]
MAKNGTGLIARTFFFVALSSKWYLDVLPPYGNGVRCAGDIRARVTHRILWELHPAHVKHTLLLVPLLLCADLTAVELVVSGGFPGCWPGYMPGGRFNSMKSDGQEGVDRMEMERETRASEKADEKRVMVDRSPLAAFQRGGARSSNATSGRLPCTGCNDGGQEEEDGRRKRKREDQHETADVQSIEAVDKLPKLVSNRRRDEEATSGRLPCTGCNDGEPSQTRQQPAIQQHFHLSSCEFPPLSLPGSVGECCSNCGLRLGRALRRMTAASEIMKGTSYFWSFLVILKTGQIFTYFIEKYAKIAAGVFPDAYVHFIRRWSGRPNPNLTRAGDAANVQRGPVACVARHRAVPHRPDAPPPGPDLTRGASAPGTASCLRRRVREVGGVRNGNLCNSLSKQLADIRTTDVRTVCHEGEGERWGPRMGTGSGNGAGELLHVLVLDSHRAWLTTGNSAISSGVRDGCPSRKGARWGRTAMRGAARPASGASTYCTVVQRLRERVRVRQMTRCRSVLVSGLRAARVCADFSKSRTIIGHEIVIRGQRGLGDGDLKGAWWKLADGSSKGREGGLNNGKNGIDWWVARQFHGRHIHKSMSRRQ